MTTAEKRAQVRRTYQLLMLQVDSLMQDLDGVSGGPTTNPRIARVQAIVAGEFKVPVGTMRSKTQERRYSVPRQLAMMFCREHTTFSSLEIGESFGGRDHGTVLHAVEATLDRMETDAEFAAQVEILRDRVIEALKPLEFPARVLAMAEATA